MEKERGETGSPALAWSRIPYMGVIAIIEKKILHKLILLSKYHFYNAMACTVRPNYYMLDHYYMGLILSL